ncbi:MAG: NnrS family protein [Mariprofundaceae bacterium]|nr:NnrS family protein [Mariprofundaceae bacterium]
MNTTDKQNDVSGFALFRLGFRPFFLVASLFAVISMMVWVAELVFSIKLIPDYVSPAYWHAHEMIYGYALAIIAGFLLTAVRNWTNIQTLHSWSLFVLVLLWLLARIAMLIPSEQALFAGLLLDNMFMVYLSVALTIPVVKAKLWKNIAVVSKVYFLLIGNVIYSLGLLGLFHDGQRIGIYIGLYMVLSLILLLSRRVVPMFIERGVGYPVTLKNHTWVDIGCFALFLLFAVTDIFFVSPATTASLAAALCVLHSIRLWGWYTHGIWQKPLLWVLYIGYGWMIVAFALKAAAFAIEIPVSLVVHAFTVGGIGMMTLGMMSRISLGHTGRDIMKPPIGVSMMFLMLLVGTVVRVILPMILPEYYQLWIALSQALWMLSFALFVYLYTVTLSRPRVDGRWG